MKIYDGTDDPYDYTHVYYHLMCCYDHSDAAKCKIFITTLKKSARLWLTLLSPSFIGSWKEICDKFHDRFSAIRRGKVTASLIKIK